jgi:dienelactone hydrolase
MACPYCAEDVRADATRCPHCGENLDDEDDDRPWERRYRDSVRRDSEPHRGSLVLTFGIISLATLLFCGLIGLPFGIAAWVMGGRDLRRMRANQMDPQGKGATEAGRVCGIVGTVLDTLWALGCLGYFGFIGLMFRQVSQSVPAGPAFAPPTAVAPANPLQNQELELQPGDYAQDRVQFRTKLLVQRGSHQPWQPVQPPAGVEEVEYPSGNLRLKAWLNPPAAGKAKLPAVLFLHAGFAFDQSDWDMAQPYRDAGYVVMTPLLRGENGLPGNFTLFFDEVNDVLAAGDYLSKLDYVDPKRVFVAGHSCGGTLTLLAAMASNRFRAAASLSGSPDQLHITQEGFEMRPFDTTDIREFELRSPLAYATSFKCPVRLYYGNLENQLRPSTLRTASFAKARKLDVEAVQVPGNHLTAVEPAIKKSIEFFRQKEK